MSPPASTPIVKNFAVLAAGFALFLIVLLLPLPEGMTESGRRLVAIVALMGVWWMGEGTSITVTALLPLVLFPLLGIMSSAEVASKYVNHLIFLFLGGFIIAVAMEKWHFHKRLALAIISVVGTRPSRIVFGFMAATAFLSMWISNTASTLMMLPVAMAVVQQIAFEGRLGGQQSDETRETIQKNLGLVLMLGLAYSASIGGVGTLIGTPPNIVLAGFYRQLFPDRAEITFVRWMAVAMPLVIVFLPLAWGILIRFASRIRLDSIEFVDGGESIIKEERRALGPPSRAEKVIGGVFVTTALLWIFRKPIDLGAWTVPGWSSLFPYPNLLHDATVAMTMSLLLFVLPIHGLRGVQWNGRRQHFLLEWKDVEVKVPWGVLLLFGGGFALAAAFSATGLDGWVGEHLTGVKGLPVWGVVLMICLGMTFLTEFTSNTATTTMILPIIAATATAAGFEPLMLMVPAALSASFAFMLPIATPPNAIVYSSGWVTVPAMARIGVVLNVIGAFLVTPAVLLAIHWLT